MNKLFARVTAPVLRDPAPETRSTRLFVRDLVLESLIGVYEHERKAPQRIRINLDLEAVDAKPVDAFAQLAKDIVAAGHVTLVETLAERIAERCLSTPAIRSVRVRVEKLDVFPDATSIGVEIERFR
ncbi:MAG TPA: dihydroneopterin aldolase [Azospirillaceae bacterium]|nr:dihydroneopterin aldolase [Azospirillaceae bacterium]